MIYVLNLAGSLLNATNGLAVACVLGYILSKQGIAYRRMLWVGAIYVFLQGLTASVVSLNLYVNDHRYDLLMATFRFCLGLCGQAVTIILSIEAVNLVKLLRERYDSEAKLADDRSKRLMQAENLVFIGEQARVSQTRQIEELRIQRAR